MVNFGLLATEICWRVWGITPANFNGFRILAALLLGNVLVGVNKLCGLNSGRHLYLAGRPSRALAHIQVSFVYSICRSVQHAQLHIAICRGIKLRDKVEGKTCMCGIRLTLWPLVGALRYWLVSVS